MEQGLVQGRTEVAQKARNCVEAAYGQHLTHSDGITMVDDSDTVAPYIDLEGLRGACREALGVNISQPALAMSANETFADGRFVKIGDVITTVPVNPARIAVNEAITALGLCD